MTGWHHRCNGHELGQALGDGEGQGGLGTLQSMGLQRVGHDWATEQKQRTCFYFLPTFLPKYDVSRQLKTSGRSQKQWERERDIFQSLPNVTWGFCLDIQPLISGSTVLDLETSPSIFSYSRYHWVLTLTNLHCKHVFTWVGKIGKGQNICSQPQATPLMTTVLESWEKGSFACPSQGPLSFSIKPGRENFRLAPQETSVVQWSMWIPLSTSHGGDFRCSLPHSALVDSIFPFHREMEGIWGMLS